MIPTKDLQIRQTRQAAVAFIVAAAATAVAGAVLFLGLQRTTDISDDMWRYPWESGDAFVAFSLFSSLLHGLVIVGLRAFGRSGVAGRSRAVKRGVALAVIGTAVLLVGELLSIPIRGAENGDTSAMIVAAVFGVGGIASMIGFLLAGWGTLRAGVWHGWRRFTPLAPGVWLAVMMFLPSTLLHGMVGVYGLCLLAMAVALYTRARSRDSSRYRPVRRARRRVVVVAIELCGLTKWFGQVLAVDGVTASIEAGKVTAFLGPNGAGKTTTLRMLLGLVAATTGTATFAGRRYDQLPDPVRHVGAMLEASGYHPGRTALDHLRVLATAARLAKDAPMRALTDTGLAEDAQRRVGEFSLGMRQRLGLAAAMLGDPAVLVLDEPTNGLDPQGIRWLRGYVRTLADEGRTVLVSSHALSEVEQTADQVLVIAEGRLIRRSTLADLRAEAGVGCRVRTPEPERLSAVLAAAGHRVRLDDDELTVDAAAEQVGELAAIHSIVLHGLNPTAGLEEAFFRLTEQAAPSGPQASIEERPA